jgi:hypothetical protein
VKTEVEVLKQQLAEALTVNQMMSNELVARAKPTLGEMSDALTAFATAAEQGNQQAKQVLTALFREMDRARASTSKLSVVRNGQS